MTSTINQSARILFKTYGFILFGMSSLSSLSATASEWAPETDLRAGLNGRTYPIGAQVTISAGIGQEFWKQEKWKYGYARFALNGATSAVVNRIGAEIQLYPVSILGLSAGYDFGSRNYTPRSIDCSSVECNGTLSRKYLRMQFLAAYQDLILSLQGRYEELRAPDAQKPFLDEMTLIVGRPEGERVLSWTPVVLYRISDPWKVGAALLYSHALDSDGESSLWGPVISHQPLKDLNLLAGVGLNHSPVVHSAFAGFFVIQWMLKGGVGLTDRLNQRFNQNASEVPGPASRTDI